MKILNKAFSIIFAIFVIFLVFLAYGSISNRWYKVITVDGNSMSPTIWVGDLILITPPTQELTVNMIVVMSVNGNLVTHRIVGFEEDGQPITKGDANQTVDNFSKSNVMFIGVYRLRLPGLGYPLLYLAQLKGNI